MTHLNTETRNKSTCKKSGISHKTHIHEGSKFVLASMCNKIRNRIRYRVRNPSGCLHKPLSAHGPLGCSRDFEASALRAFCSWCGPRIVDTRSGISYSLGRGWPCACLDGCSASYHTACGASPCAGSRRIGCGAYRNQ